MSKQLFYFRTIRYQYSEAVRQKAIALIENRDRGDGPPTTYLEAADFFNGAPCATTIRRWVLEERFRLRFVLDERFRREVIEGVIEVLGGDDE